MWAKAIESLADIGYDSTNMVAMPYDWRLSIPNMELRDGYFSKLRYQARPPACQAHAITGIARLVSSAAAMLLCRSTFLGRHASGGVEGPWLESGQSGCGGRRAAV